VESLAGWRTGDAAAPLPLRQGVKFNLIQFRYSYETKLGSKIQIGT
jgi:hypothetical protein